MARRSTDGKSINDYVGTNKRFTDVQEILGLLFEDEEELFEEKGDVDSDLDVDLGDDVNNNNNYSDFEYEEETISASNIVNSNLPVEEKLSGTDPSLEISPGNLAVPLLSSTAAEISSETEEEIIEDDDIDIDFLPKPSNFAQK